MSAITDRRHFILGAATAVASLGAAKLLSGCSLLPSWGAGAGSGGAGSAGTGAGTGGEDANPSNIPVGKAGGTLRFASHFPYSIDPFYLEELAGIQIAAALFDPLVRYDYKTGKLVGAAAESWRVTQNGTVFSFTLIEGARFHNGEPVTATAFKYSWERLLKPDPSGTLSPNAPHIAMIQGADELMAGTTQYASGIRIVNALTFEVTLTMPCYDFLTVLTYPPFAPVPPSGIADNLSVFSGQPVGNGPFRISDPQSWGKTSLRLDRFDDYYGEPALLKAIEFCFFESDRGDTGLTYEQKTYEGLVYNELDVAAVPLAQLEDARMRFGESPDGYTALPGDQVLVGEESYTEFLWANFHEPPLSDPNVRKALSYAIDRKALCRELYADVAQPASGLVPPSLEGFRDGAWPAVAYDPDKARKALRQALREGLQEADGIGGAGGAGDTTDTASAGGTAGAGGAASAGGTADEDLPRTITLVAHDTAFERKLFEMLRANLEEVGFIVRSLVVETQAQYWDVLGRSAAIALTGWIADYPLLDNFFTPIFATFGNYNKLDYNNPQVDEGIVAARSIMHPGERLKAYQKVDDMLANDMPVIPLFFMKHALACSDRVNDFTISPDGMTALPKVWVSW